MDWEGPVGDVAALLDEIDQGVAVLDRERAIYLFINRAGVALARRPANELLGRSFWDLYPDVVDNPVYVAFQRVVAGAGRQRVPAFHYPSWDRWFEADLLPLGRHVAALWRDVTESVMRRRAEDSLRAERDAREQIIGIVAHDLRSPIAAIRFAAAALEHTADAASNEIARSIGETTHRLDRRIATLLDFSVSRVGDGIRLDPAPVDLGHLCDVAAADLRALRPGCEVLLERAGDLRGTWDGERLLQVLENILDNAARHGGDEPISVSVTGDDDASVRVAVHNVGAPIAPELLPHVFEPYRRASGPRHQRSVGLGLYVASQITAAHGGTITVRSPDGDGTTFVVTLPRRPPA
jgi:signal transduction histidine kinase